MNYTDFCTLLLKMILRRKFYFKFYKRKDVNYYENQCKNRK